MPKEIRHVSVALDAVIARRLEEMRARDGMSVNAQIRRAVLDWIARRDEEIAIIAAHRRKEKKTA